MNRQGFSLTEALIAGAILSGMALFGAKLFQGQNSALKYSKARSEVDVFHARLSGLLSDYRNCNSNFFNFMPGNSNAGSPLSGNLTRLTQCCPDPATNPGCSLDPAINPAATGACQTSAYPYASNLKEIIKSGVATDKVTGFKFLSAEIQERNGGTSIFSAGNEVKSAVLKVHYQLVGDATGERSIYKLIPLSFRFTSGLGFTGCVDAESNSKKTLQREICEALGNLAMYNPTSEQCEPLTSHNCPGGEVLVGIDSNGNDVCGSAQMIFNKPDIINPANAAGCSAGSGVRFIKGADNRIRLECF